jgi:predicted ArsR family transcriptional regulator
VNDISQKFTVSRQAVTKHIQYLSDAGLVRMQTQGRNTLCFPDFRPMKDVNGYISEFRKFWSRSLDKLEEYLDSGAVD